MTAWVTVANVEDLPQGETLGVTVVNLRDRYVEIGAARTHAGLPPQRRHRARP
jgi:hypothetical protein